MWFWHVPFWCLSQILKVLLRSLHSGLSVLQRFVSSRLSESRSVASLCNPVDCSPPGSSVRGILQARILEWVTIPFSRGSSQPRDLLNCRQILYHLSHHRSPQLALNFSKFANLYSENILAFQMLWKNFSGNK